MGTLWSAFERSAYEENKTKKSCQINTGSSMTATKGETSTSLCNTEKRKSWASIIKRTISFSNLSRNDKDNTNGQPAASSASTTPAKSQSRLSVSLSTKRGSLDYTSSIPSFNSTYNSKNNRRSSQPPQEFWW